MTAPREFLNEVQERFLKGVLTKLPIERIAELYLFQPIKQGGMESGVAVIASVPEAPPAPEPSVDADASAPVEAEAQGAADAGTAAELEVLDDAGAGAELGVVEETAEVESDAEAAGDAEAVAGAEADAAPASDEELAELDTAIVGDGTEAVAHGEIRAPREDVVAASADEELEALGESGAGAELGVVEESAEDADAEAAAEGGEEPSEEGEASLEEDDELADVEPEPIDTDEEYPSQVAARYTVYSANYRLVLKGPDRGKWALDVKAEADAPLITLESVVRGVQHRSGDVEPPRRYDQAELRALLRIPDSEAPSAP